MVHGKKVRVKLLKLLPACIFLNQFLSTLKLAEKSVSVLEGPLSTAKYIAAVNFAKFEIFIYRIVAIIKTRNLIMTCFKTKFGTTQSHIE